MKKEMKILKKINKNSILDVLEHSVEPVLITDASWDKGIKIIYVNRTFCTTTGYTRKELIGKNPKIFQGEESNFKVLKELKTELIKGNHFLGQSINYKKDKSSYIVKWSISPLKDKKGDVIAYISFQKTISRDLNLKKEKLLSSVVDTSKNLILVTDLEGIIVYTNDAFSKKLGYEKGELIGSHSRILKSGMQSEKFYKNMWNSILSKGSFSDTFISKKKDGTLFYDKKQISTIKDEQANPIYYVSYSIDITKQIENEKELKTQIYIDELTQTYNRKKYELTIQEYIKSYITHKEVFTLILIDIDFFKVINDEYGHDIGDYILTQFAELIQSNIRGEDKLFRWGGEEFALLIKTNSEKAMNLAQKLKNIINKKSFQSIKITASFGISQVSPHTNKEMIFSQADQALYKAKNSGRNRIVTFEKEQNSA